MISMPRRRGSGYIARSAPNPPSVVADPPTPTTMRRAPASMALAMSSPVPVVDAASGSLFSAPPSRLKPDAAAISMTAVPPDEAPRRGDRITERAGDEARAIRAAQRIEGALAAVGQRAFVALGARRAAAAAGDGCGDLARGSPCREICPAPASTRKRIGTQAAC